ncbi:GDYXXLXY domain-containing protein [Pulveribacter suum]|uniref:DUF4401 domain-containing protein n=1 Tax=Pulveribacter suum TaxID=2116657 RepID=A0A2P1NGM2_9BURK|nr:GDYXXLXY domain-containing protein [Pulveribacter suum]AVP56217.1 hypothetical protein C7H73_00095 [Pulveribacter suum]
MKAQHELVRAAQAQGLLPPQASGAGQQGSDASWVVSALGFIGALLVSLLGLLLLALVSGSDLFTPPGSVVVALLLSGGAVWTLRAGGGMFAQQLAVSLLLCGQALWLVGWGLEGAASPALRIGLLLGLLALQLAVAWSVPVRWVQRLLGLLAAGTFLLLDLWPAGHEGAELLPWGLGAFPAQPNLWLLALAWAGWCVLSVRGAPRTWAPRASALADGVGVALLLAPLVAQAQRWLWLASVPMMGSADAADAGTARLFAFHWTVAVQMALVLAGGLWLLAWHWRENAGVRAARPALALVYALALLACWVMPHVGVAALVGSVALGTGRRRLLVLVLVLMLLQLSQFYYALQWPLTDKALLLAASGAALALALLALGGRPGRRAAGGPASPAAGQPGTPARRWLAPALIAAGGALALGLVHRDALHKEEVVLQGHKIYVALAPRDPRSLMQGDYMALDFSLGPVRSQLQEEDAAAGRRASAWVVARLDGRGVASVQRLAGPQADLAPGEVLLPLRRLKGAWTLVTDAFFFPEGQGGSLAQARFGEFRVLPGGRALLVGLADEQLQPIAPQPRPPEQGDAPDGEDAAARAASAAEEVEEAAADTADADAGPGAAAPANAAQPAPSE